MKKKAKRVRNKEEICEDWCFVCKDGGLLLVCDYKQCLKAYHAYCVGKDDSVFDSDSRWNCRWHSCFICHKSSKFHCFCCPNAVCKYCITGAEFAYVRGDKGFCNHCLKLARLSEENMDVDSDGEKVDFKDRETYEGLFREYWEIIKEQEGLTSEHLCFADAQLNKGEKFKSGSYLDKSDLEEESQLVSDFEEDEDIEEHKPVQKKKISKGQQVVKKRVAESNKREFIGWGSKSLIDFLASIGKDTSKIFSQYEVSSIINAYINENRLFHSEKKKKILCDERLKSVLGRKTVNRNKIYDLLDPHFLENQEPSEEDELYYSSEDKDENVLATYKKQRKSSTCSKSQEKEVVFDAPQTCLASIVSENIKLVYLRRCVVEELLKQPETFELKIIGSFVRVKSEAYDFFQRNSHQLVQVTGIKKTSRGENTEILLKVSNMYTDICINMLSDDNFSEEECDDLRQKVKDGLLRKPNIVELEQKARSLHKDITKHWIARELVLLQNLIDRANEKGWRRELFEYMERKKLLQTESEQLRLLEEVPKVIADVAEIEPMSKDALKESTKGDERSPKSILIESLETPDDDWGGSGISPGITEAGGHRAVTHGKSAFENGGYNSANDGNENEQATQRNNDGSNMQVAKKNGTRSLAIETCILEEKPCLTSSEEREKHSKASVIEELTELYRSHEDQCSIPVKQTQPKDSEQKDMTIHEASAVQFIDLSSDNDDSDGMGVAVGKQKPKEEEDWDVPVWQCIGPNGEKKGPFSLELLKRWSEASPFALKFKVWKTGESEEHAIPLGNAI